MEIEYRIRTIFVQIKCRPGTAYKVADRIMDSLGATIAELHSTSGSFDLLARFRIEPGVDPGLFVTERVQTIEDITDTYTIIGFNAYTPRSNPA
jgi:hypothetical protein